MYRLYSRIKYPAGFAISGAILGISLNISWPLLALSALFIQFFLLNSLYYMSLKNRLLCLFCGQISFMIAASYWFRHILALGWADIAGVSPQTWLLVLVFFVCLVCALAGTVTFCFTNLIHKSNFRDNPIKHAYIMSTSYLLAELARNIVFSTLTLGNGMPLAPSWNIFTIGSLGAGNMLGYAGKFVGLWGVSFLFYFIASLLALLFINRRNISFIRPVRQLSCLILIASIVIIGSRVNIGNTSEQTIKLIAVRKDDSNYLSRLTETLDVDDVNMTVVVLPEYSSLLHPYANSGLFGLNYDARLTFPETFRNRNVYFVGTEDEYIEGRRYVETYIVNGQLEKFDRKVKQFLIPGGEYIPGWTKRTLRLIDSGSIDHFMQTRERYVIEHPSHLNAPNKNVAIGTGACSALLTPYHFQKEVKNGALILTSNVSYMQFQSAPEYERIANRFAQFTAVSTERPMAIGAHGGASVIYGNNGDKLAESTPGTSVAQATVTQNNGKTIYVLLGDKIILMILISPLLLLAIRRRSFIGLIKSLFTKLKSSRIRHSKTVS